MPLEVVFYDGKAISVELPTSVEREITWTEPAVKGDTSGKVLKPAKIATGFEIGVPLFVAQGDKHRDRHPHRRIPQARLSGARASDEKAPSGAFSFAYAVGHEQHLQRPHRDRWPGQHHRH